jgi:ribosome-associated protein
VRRAATREDVALTSVALPAAGVSPLPPAKTPKGAAAVAQDKAVLQSPLLKAVLDALDDSKAENVVAIDLAGKTTLADTMAVATGRATTHVGAIADRVIKACKAAGVAAPRVEGMPHNDWVLVDAGDVIVHIFRPEVRLFYNLEKMWGGDRPSDAPTSGVAAKVGAAKTVVAKPAARKPTRRSAE